MIGLGPIGDGAIEVDETAEQRHFVRYSTPMTCAYRLATPVRAQFRHNVGVERMCTSTSVVLWFAKAFIHADELNLEATLFDVIGGSMSDVQRRIRLPTLRWTYCICVGRIRGRPIRLNEISATFQALVVETEERIRGTVKKSVIQ